MSAPKFGRALVSRDDAARGWIVDHEGRPPVTIYDDGTALVPSNDVGGDPGYWRVRPEALATDGVGRRAYDRARAALRKAEGGGR